VRKGVAEHLVQVVNLAVAILWILLPALANMEDTLMNNEVPENTYRAELVSYPGAYGFEIGKSAIILVSDQELEMLSDPDRVLNLSLTFEKHEASLRQVCERAKAAGHRTLIIAFDHFFSQYRPGQAGPRRYTPDMDEYVQRIAGIARFAQGYGLGLELSLLSPLEVGPAYRARTGECGVWMQYRKGLRDPKTGAFSVQLWRHKRWANNKGVVELEDAGVRVFAFRERPIPGTPYRVVDPSDIVEISETAKVEVFPNVQARAGDFTAQRIRVYGEGRTDVGDLNRVLVVQVYRSPEMDYFSDKALPFLKSLVDKYADAGVKLNALYSDEMHIQQDWAYFNHHEHGEFAMRYVTDSLARRYAQLYGERYRDFARYLIYFVYAQEDFASDLSARQPVMHVFGSTPEAIRETALFRARYYRLLQDGVVDLFVAAKRYAEQRMGHKLEARAHATWAESPTVDYWQVGQENMNRHKYEYTPNFVWSVTVHQAASACYDYFRWGDFLTGNGNDHSEGGWLDRNYYGLALGCSTGILNEVPYSYAAHWGSPQEISQRHWWLQCAYGTAGGYHGRVQGMQHRAVEVLMLYPLDLVAVEERFGSWMTQYGYANYITQWKLLEQGKLEGGAIRIGDYRFTTLVALFEPFPSRKTLELMQKMVEAGGRVIWSGPPPVLTAEGEPALPLWQQIFGVRYTPGQNEGIAAPGRAVTFAGMLKDVTPQTILTDFLVDHIYPVQAEPGTEVVATVGERVVGTLRRTAGGGMAAFLGYRPRDDQSCSLGYDARNWFEILSTLGAYPPTGKFPGVNDNTEYLSRTGQYLVTRFPNGAIAIAPHTRNIVEDWSGGFARNRQEDERVLQRLELPSERVEVKDFPVNGHRVTVNASGTVSFRVDERGELAAFCGSDCTQIEIDGKRVHFAERIGENPLALVAWAPVARERQVPNGAVMEIQVHGAARLMLSEKLFPREFQLFLEGATPGSRGREVPFRREGGSVIIEVSPELSGRWIFVVVSGG
jgi:hypothetical protein